VGEVDAEGKDVGEVVDDLERQFPGLRDRLCDETGDFRKFINVYVNQEDIRFLQGRESPLKDGDEVSIVPAIAGGR
jgi:sulfur-carrier protein